MADKKLLEKIIKYCFFGIQIALFTCVTIIFIVKGRGFGIHTFFWFIVFSMPICIIFGIIALTVDKKIKK